VHTRIGRDFGANLILASLHSTGTSVPRVLSPQCNYRSVATPWMCNILFWSLALPSVIFKYTICQIHPHPTRSILVVTRPFAPVDVAVFQTITSPLKWQTRVVTCFTNSTSSGFAVGSIEGRVAIQYVLARSTFRVVDSSLYRYVEDKDST
jgi:hypothetical protein